MSSPEMNDVFLLEFFRDNIDDIEYISNKYVINEKDFLVKSIDKQLIDLNSRKESEQYFSRQDFINIKNIWKNLLEISLLYLKMKDDREENIHDKEVFGINKLSEYYAEFKDHERVLFGSKKRYRDHIFHMFRVFLLGEYLVRKNYENKFEDIEIYDVKDYIKNDILDKKSLSGDIIESMWCIISLTHDLGYPLENSHKINEPMRKIMKYFGKMDIKEFDVIFPSQSRFIDDFITKFISSKLIIYNNPNKKDKKNNKKKSSEFITVVQPKYYLKFSKEFEEYRHGIISCVLLMKNLIYFLESDYVMSYGKTIDSKDAIQFIIRREILRSIAAHCCDEIYHYSTNNLQFLLLITDEMQSWGRPFFSELFTDETPRNNKLIVNKFDKENIDYLIKWENNNKENAKEDLFEYGVNLFEHLNKVFRSGVDTGNRDFDINCRLTVKCKRTLYSLLFSHIHPSKVKGKTQFITGNIEYSINNKNTNNFKSIGEFKDWKENYYK